MTFVTFLTLSLAAVLALGVTRAADRHRRWTLALVERHRRRVLDAVDPAEREAWQMRDNRPAAPVTGQPAVPGSRRIELRVRD